MIAWRRAGIEGMTRMARAARPALLAALLGVATMTGSIASLNWWLGDHALVLSYVKVLVWPVALMSAVIWLRDPIRQKIGELTKASFGPGSVDFQQQVASDHLTADLKRPVSVLDSNAALALATPEVEVEGDASLAPNEPADVKLEVPLIGPNLALAPDDLSRESERPVSEAARRGAIEKIIRDSAGWGWDMAGIGFKSRPLPVIEWTSDGSPRILYGEGKSGRPGWTLVSGRHGAEYGRRLEREIKEIESQLNSPQRMTSLEKLTGADQVLADRLAEMKARLREVDPNSPYAD
jgi:hypothetical protein